ncbi:hypothetical protein PT974_02243 [Cladobotryum mycophilum]|uniref:Uncharacterized protein n=1 Tax=Cladobotryum mycophilum TaxID=491253 RepID=A0ABR0SXI4_9HYPO
MHDYLAARQQVETAHSARTPASTMPSTPQIRRRASFRERFWSKASANYNSDDDDFTPDSHATTVRRSVYIPVCAASGFANTVSSPREPQFKGHLSAMREDEEEEASTASSKTLAPAATRLSQQLIEPGHLYVHTELEPQSEEGDFAAFIAAAEADERARRVLAAAEQRGSLVIGGASHKRRDSGYYSSSFGPRDRDPYSRSPPAAVATPAAATPRTLKRQQSIRAFGQRIAEYIRPLRPEPASTPRTYGQ